MIDLFDPPEPPSGPPADVPSPDEGQFSAYQAWKETREGREACRWIRDQALAQLARGENRISARTLVAEAREVLKVKINDHYSPWIADDLIARYPALLPVIERRKRVKAKV